LKQARNAVLEVVSRSDAAFDILVNGELRRTKIQEAWLNPEVCVRFGFGGKEYDSSVRDLTWDGRARIEF
jgi:hypothetical protein